MRHFFQFILLGLLTAAVGEWQFSVFLRGDLQNFVGSVFVNTLYMTGVYLLTRLVLPALRSGRWVIFPYTAFFGFSGLMVEWFLIGNSPWGNPDANQPGMFAYWACMALVPLVFWIGSPALKQFTWRYGLVYTLLVVLGQFLIPDGGWRFAFHIYAVIFGYLGLMGLLVWRWRIPPRV